MARTWLSIRVDLVEGMHAHELWPRPGRILLARPGMTFRMRSDAINDAFARWDRTRGEHGHGASDWVLFAAGIAVAGSPKLEDWWGRWLTCDRRRDLGELRRDAPPNSA